VIFILWKGGKNLLIIRKNYIGLTKGDTAEFDVEISTGTYGTYKCVTGDTLVFSLKKMITDTVYVMQKTVTTFPDGNIFVIHPSDTNSLALGLYVYDVQVTLASSAVYTVIPPTQFELLNEVTTA